MRPCGSGRDAKTVKNPHLGLAAVQGASGDEGHAAMSRAAAGRADCLPSLRVIDEQLLAALHVSARSLHSLLLSTQLAMKRNGTSCSDERLHTSWAALRGAAGHLSNVDGC